MGALLLCATFASGESVDVELIGASANDGQFYVLPYELSINGDPVEAICYDALHEISMDQTWSANLLTVNEAATSGVFGGNANSLQNYQTVAYLASWWYTDSANMTLQNQIDLQYAIWDVFDPGAFALPPAGTDPFLDNVLANEGSGMASLNYNDYTFLEAIPYQDGSLAQQFILYTPGGGGNELLLTPEPGSWMLAGIGLTLIGVSRMRSRRAL